MPTAWLLLATDNEVNQIAYNVQETNVSQCASAYHCQIKNSSSVVVDTAASSVAREGGLGTIAPSLTCRPKCISKIPRFQHF